MKPNIARILVMTAFALTIFLAACGNHTTIELEDISFERGEGFVHIDVTLLCWELGSTGRLTCEDPCATAIFYRELEEQGGDDDGAETDNESEEQEEQNQDTEAQDEDDHYEGDYGRSLPPVSEGEELVDMVTECAEVTLTKDETVTIELRSSVEIPQDEGIKLRIQTTPRPYNEDFYEIEDFR